MSCVPRVPQGLRQNNRFWLSAGLAVPEVPESAPTNQSINAIGRIKATVDPQKMTETQPRASNVKAMQAREERKGAAAGFFAQVPYFLLAS